MTAGGAAAWPELVGVGLLGTDRRSPPPPADPDVAAVVADALAPNDARRLLTAVSATVVAERCGIVPEPPRLADEPPVADPRPTLSVAAAELWRRLAVSFPLLEPEWLHLAAANGWRPPPDVLVDLLRRATTQPDRHAAVMRFGGPLAGWLVEQLPELAARGSASAKPTAGGAAAASAVPPELAACYARDADAFATELLGGVLAGRYTWPQRRTLHHALAELPSGWLDHVLDALAGARRGALAGEGAGGDGAVALLPLWDDLIEFAGVRRAVHAELEIVR